jgi:RNA polymerase sigma-70 factor, ECF subfamily
MASSLPAAAFAPHPISLDQAEFRRLVERMAGRLLRLAARVVGDRALAEDVVQEAWTSAFQAHRQQRFEGRAAVDTWLYRIVLRAALNARRSRSRRDRVAASSALTFPLDSGASLDARVALREVAALLDLLPEEQASALVLKEFEGLTAAEVARALDCSKGAVEQRLVRARATLRERLSHD